MQAELEESQISYTEQQGSHEWAAEEIAEEIAQEITQEDGVASDDQAAKPHGKNKEPAAEGAFMAFDRGVASAKAKALVGTLVEMIEAREQAEEKRQRARRQQAREDLVALVGRFAGELVAAVDRDALPLLPCSKNSNELAEREVSYSAFIAIFDSFEGLGLIETVVRGSFGRWEPAEGGSFIASPSQIVRRRGWVTRIQPTKALLELVRQHGIKPHTAFRHFPRLRPPAPLQLREGSTWAYGDKVRGDIMRIDKTPETDRLNAEIQELNEFIRKVTIEGVEGTELTGWTRGFNEGDHEEFAWDRGGRLYARPGDATYQSLPSVERGQLLLNSEPVVEIDIKASHLHIVYALRCGASVTVAGRRQLGLPVWARTSG